MPKDLLLEVGTEELPARFMTPALEQLKSVAQSKLTQAGLAFQTITVFGTPRRLALFVTNVAEKSPDQIETILGPLAKEARDGTGQWKPAAMGFAKSLKLEPEQLKTFAGPRGERLGIERVKTGEPTSRLLVNLLPDIISSLRFPKSMVWEESRFAFARPIRWILALFGIQVVKFRLAGVASSANTFGPLEISLKKIKVSHPGRYLTLLKNRCVIADPEARQKLVRRLLDEAARHLKGNVLAPPELFEEVVQLVEHPTALTGSFSPKYLELPGEILRSVMQTLQKFFPVAKSPPSQRDGDTPLQNHFVAIRNGTSEHQQEVREGYERVLAARLADAEFFFKQDSKKKLEEIARGLNGISFHEKLGSMADKVHRITQLSKMICPQLHLPLEYGLEARVVRVAQLCKADLLTHIVYEFPELQGIAGRIYAKKDKEPQEIAAAIEEHYWPMTTEGPLPRNVVGSILSLADKLDTLCADFSVGIIPTGSADPHGLKKAGTSVLRLLIENRWNLRLDKLVEWTCGLIQNSDTNLQKQILEFLRNRLENWLISRQYRPDEIAAVMAVDFYDISDCLARLDVLKTIRTQPDFGPLSIAFKRTVNIIEQARQKGIWNNETKVDENSLKEQAEKKLYDQFSVLHYEIEDRLNRRDYKSALASLVTLKNPIDAFFEQTMVMTDDPALRSNRLAILSAIAKLFSRFANFKLLQDTSSVATPASHP